jgi:mannitol 2-dehydrogenase
MTDLYEPAPAAQPLSNETTDDPRYTVYFPSYDRGSLTAGVVHIGVGGFHRAHQGVYFHELAQRGVTDWSIVGVSLQSRGMKEALETQDLLYTVVERGSGDDSAHVVGTLERYLYAPEDPEGVLEALSDPRIRIVTLTVTGDGYHVDISSREFRSDAPAVRADLERPSSPATFFAYVVEALDRRRRNGDAPFTVLSCDNVPRNGEIARLAVVSFARLRDPELAAWIDEHVTFPCSMVDRITPESTGAFTEYVNSEFGLADCSPVTTEPFRQWIVEDDFCNGRPPLEDVGVQFVEDTTVYELMKKRMLNGTHSALGYLGYLAGHRTTDGVMADPLLHAYASRLLGEEIVPLLPEVPGIDLAEYKDTLLERLANPNIGDELQRLCRRGSTKVPSYLLPSVCDALRADGPHDLLTLGVAGWLRYLRGTDFQGRPIRVQDARLSELQPLVLAGGNDPRVVLRDRLFGGLGDDEGFATRLEAALTCLDERGARGALEAYLGLA